MPKVKFVHAETLVKLSREVQAMLEKNWDLYQQGPVNLGNEVGQWMVEGKSFYEYCLLIVPSPEALNRMAEIHIDEGWDFFGNTVAFENELAQWVCKDTGYEQFKHTLAANEISFS